MWRVVTPMSIAAWSKGHVLSEHTVQNLESCLFFLSQCHILHKGSVTFMLAS